MGLRVHERKHVFMRVDAAQLYNPHPICRSQLTGAKRRSGWAMGRFEAMMSVATQVLGVLLERASRVPRNYIIDQTK